MSFYIDFQWEVAIFLTVPEIGLPRFDAAEPILGPRAPFYGL